MKKIISIFLVALMLCVNVSASGLSEDAFLKQLNTIADMEDLQYMFEQNNYHINMKIVKPSMYFNLDSSGLTRFYRAVMKNRPYYSVEDAEERLHFYLTIESINTNKYPVIETAFAYAEKYYELNLSDLYALSEKYREKVIAEFTTYHSHTSIAEIQRRLDAVTDKYSKLEDEEFAKLKPLVKTEADKNIIIKDLTVSEWAFENVSKAVSKGFIPQNFGSDYTLPITREEFCKVAYLAVYEKGKFDIKNVESPFEDSDNEAVVALWKADVIKGTDKTHFSPDKEITREESAVIIHRLMKYLKIKTDDTDYNVISKEYLFSDHQKISDWAKQAVYSLQRSKIMNGVGNNLFDPEGKYTKEQSIAVILRMISI